MAGIGNDVFLVCSYLDQDRADGDQENISIQGKEQAEVGKGYHTGRAKAILQLLKCMLALLQPRELFAFLVCWLSG